MNDATKIKEYLTAISVWNVEIADYEAKIEQCRQKRSDLIENLKNETEQTFEFEGKWYMIKSRKKSGINSLVQMDVKPGSWRKKKEAA